jgi:hypothetical protein
MVQVDSQNLLNNVFKTLLSYSPSSQIWLNLPVDHPHFGYNTKLNPKIKIHLQKSASISLTNSLSFMKLSFLACFQVVSNRLWANTKQEKDIVLKQ